VSTIINIIERAIAAAGNNPVMGLFVINAGGIGAAVWFLDRLVTNNAERLDLILKSCLPH